MSFFKISLCAYIVRDYFPNLRYSLVDTSMTLANGKCQIAVAPHTSGYYVKCLCTVCHHFQRENFGLL